MRCAHFFPLFLFIFISIRLSAQTTHWKLTWEQNPEPDIVQYNIYKYEKVDSEAEPTLQTINVQTSDTTRLSIKDSIVTYQDEHLTKGFQYYYKVTAVNSENSESAHSDSASASIPELKGIADQTVLQGMSFSTFTLSDLITYSGKNPLVCSLLNEPYLDVEIDEESTRVTVSSPSLDWYGQEELVFCVSDSQGFYDTDTACFCVTQNRAHKIITNPDKSGSFIEEIIYMEEDSSKICLDTIWFKYVDDPDSLQHSLSYTIKKGDHIIPADSSSYKILYPNENFFGNDTLLLIVSDTMYADSAFFVVQVNPIQDPPSTFDLIKPVNEETLIRIDTVLFEWHKAIDPDRDLLRYTLFIEEETGQLDTLITDLTGNTYLFNGNGFLFTDQRYIWWMQVSDGIHTIDSDTFCFDGPILNTVDSEKTQTPAFYSLSQNYPNPFNPVTTIDLSLPIAGYVRITIYNILGQKVALPLEKFLPAGKHSIRYDASELPSGTYFYMVRTGNFQRIRKMILRK